jgi:hypothetical protein
MTAWKVDDPIFQIGVRCGERSKQAVCLHDIADGKVRHDHGEKNSAMGVGPEQRGNCYQFSISNFQSLIFDL